MGASEIARMPSDDESSRPSRGRKRTSTANYCELSSGDEGKAQDSDEDAPLGSDGSADGSDSDEDAPLVRKPAPVKSAPPDDVKPKKSPAAKRKAPSSAPKKAPAVTPKTASPVASPTPKKTTPKKKLSFALGNGTIELTDSSASDDDEDDEEATPMVLLTRRFTPTAKSERPVVSQRKVKTTYTLWAIEQHEVPKLLAADLEEEINAVARRTPDFEDFDLAADLKVDDPESNLFDYLFYLQDENGDVVGFRSAVWDTQNRAWLFQNGVVRDKGNALGSHLMQNIVRYFLTLPQFQGRNAMMADVEKQNKANVRLYQNFICRTNGHDGKKFKPCKPSSKAPRQGFVAFRFDAN